MARHVAASVADLPPGSRLLVEIAGRPVALFNVDGEIFAILNRCPHAGGSLVHGYLTGRLTSPCPGDYDYSAMRELIRCPWHAWEFDLRTGQSWCEPERVKPRRYVVSVAEAADLAEDRLVAETYPVSLEGTYILVEI